MLSDVVVFKRIKDGDIKTFEMVFSQYYTPLCLYAYSITIRKDIAEEVVQDVFYNIWKERHRIQILQSIKNYLYGAVKNQSLRYRERLMIQEKHREYVLSHSSLHDELSPQEELEYKELEEIIRRTLERLPERCRKIFLMHRMEDKKYKEIANYFSLSVKTVEAEMTKAYRMLRQEIEKYTQNNDF